MMRVESPPPGSLEIRSRGEAIQDSTRGTVAEIASNVPRAAQGIAEANENVAQTSAVSHEISEVNQFKLNETGH